MGILKSLLDTSVGFEKRCLGDGRLNAEVVVMRPITLADGRRMLMKLLKEGG